jgi:hypothetical protein
MTLPSRQSMCKKIGARGDVPRNLSAAHRRAGFHFGKEDT